MGQTLPKHKLPRSQIRRLQRHVSFSEDEIQDWYEEFCLGVGRTHHGLFLDEDAFVKVYNDVFPGQSNEFARHVFRTFDLDENRKVDFREFLIGLSISGSENMQKKLAWAFQVYDVDRTGFITLESMTQITRAVFKMMGGPTLRHNDITVTPESMALDLFDNMDRDGDQRISWLMFRKGVMRDPTALRLLQCSPPENRVENDNDVYR
ncbi:hypothetical protein ACOMHN_065091 [Nucella lapillus]